MNVGCGLAILNDQFPGLRIIDNSRRATQYPESSSSNKQEIRSKIPRLRANSLEPWTIQRQNDNREVRFSGEIELNLARNVPLRIHDPASDRT